MKGKTDAEKVKAIRAKLMEARPDFAAAVAAMEAMRGKRAKEAAPEAEKDE